MVHKLVIQDAPKDLDNLCILYKNSTTENRAKLLKEQRDRIRSLTVDVTSNQQASQVYGVLTDVNEFLKYTDLLHAMENQGYFEVLGDYAGMIEYLDRPKYAPLKEYFEFKLDKTPTSTVCLMKYKKSLDVFSRDIWDLFHDMQVTFFAEKKCTWAKITKGVAYDPQYQASQIYPGPQGLGDIKNGAVDKVYVEEGSFLFVEVVPGLPQLPAGGMRAAGDGDFTGAAKKLLNEFIEEENGTFYQTSSAYYNQLDSKLFKEALTQSLSEGVGKAFSASLAGNLTPFQDQFNVIVRSEKANSYILEDLIRLINTYKSNDDPAKSKIYNEMKGALQVETIKLHPRYDDTVQFILENSVAIKKRMLTDGRQMGGSQESIIFVMKKSIRQYFEQSWCIYHFEAGDDVTDGKFIKKTMLDILETGVRWMHGAVACVGLQHVLQTAADANEYRKGWSDEQYGRVKNSIDKRLSLTISYLTDVPSSAAKVSMFSRPSSPSAGPEENSSLQSRI